MVKLFFRLVNPFAFNINLKVKKSRISISNPALRSQTLNITNQKFAGLYLYLDFNSRRLIVLGKKCRWELNFFRFFGTFDLSIDLFRPDYSKNNIPLVFNSTMMVQNQKKETWVLWRYWSIEKWLPHLMITLVWPTQTCLNFPQKNFSKKSFWSFF